MKAARKSYNPVTNTALRIFVWVFFMLWLSGIAWIALQFTKSEPAEIHTSAQTLLMKLHGAIAMASLLVLGAFAVHIREGLSIGSKMRSGISIVLTMLLLIISGWLLYYASADLTRSVASWSHIILGALVPIFLFAHGILCARIFKS